MLLTITNTSPPATDLGYLLHKNPARAQAFDLPFGKAHVFYPESSPERCTAALLLEVDPVGLVRGRSGTLGQYVNDRPYAASSFLSVAISRVFGLGREPVLHGGAFGGGAAAGPLEPPVRARAGARRRQALLGRRRGGREAPAARGGVALLPPREGAHRGALPQAPARPHPRRTRPAHGRRRGRGRRPAGRGCREKGATLRGADRGGACGAKGRGSAAGARPRVRRGEAAPGALRCQE